MRCSFSLLLTVSFLWMSQTSVASTHQDDDNDSAPVVGTVGHAPAMAISVSVQSGASLCGSPMVSGTFHIGSFNLNALIFSRELGLLGPLQKRYIKALHKLAEQTSNPNLFKADHASFFACLSLAELEELVDQKSLVGALSPLSQEGHAYFALEAKLKDASVQSLDYSDRGLLLCPPLRDATHLEKLYLNYNDLPFLEDLSALTKLQELSLSLNQLTEVPHGLSKLTMLRVLNLGNNQLKALPDGLSTLSNLQKLYVHQNQLKALPEGLSALTNLERLDLQDNYLKELPEGLSALTNLQDLYLHNNQLREVPYGISELMMLRRLSLDASLCQDEKLLNALREINRNRDRYNKISLYACSKNAQEENTQERVNLD